MNEGFTRDFSIEDLQTMDPTAVMNASKGRPDNGRTIPEFFMRAFRDEQRSAALGRAVHLEKEMVRIYIPGDKNNIVEKRVTPEIINRYPKHYEAFKKRQELAPDGTLIDNWAFLSRAQVYDLKAQHIFTVEQLAALSDEQLAAVGLGARQLRKYAQEFIRSSESGKASTQLVAENQHLTNQISLLTQQVTDLARRLEAAMVKAGDRPEDAPTSPLTQAKLAVSASAGVDLTAKIPENYTGLGLPKLKEIISGFTTTPVRTKEEALQMIEEFLAKKHTLVA